MTTQPIPIERGRRGMNVMDWAGLVADRGEPPPTIRPGVPEVGVTVVAGSPKVGKTLLVSQWALESRRRTLMVIEEGSQEGIGYRLRRQAEAVGVVAPPVHVALRQRIRLDDRKSTADLAAVVHEYQPAVVVMDPLNRLHNGDENRPSDMTRVMDTLGQLAYDAHCAVLAVHHLAKPSAERRGDIWDRFRGASSIRSGTDANLVMDGKGDRVHLVGEFRDAEPLSEWLELDRETLTFVAADGPDAIPSKVDAIALRAFVQEREMVTAADVMAQFEVSKPTALGALRGLGCDEFEGVRRQLSFTLATGK